MMEVLLSGPANTIQDGGRFGYRDIGITRGGVMDRLAFAAGNALLGNPAGAAAVEIAMFPFRVRFSQPTAIAVTGAACDTILGGRRLPPCWAMPVAAGDELVVGPPEAGARAYLCIAGGIDVPPVLASRSTDLKAGFGGHEGRGLARGDRLFAAPAAIPALPPEGLGALPYGDSALPGPGGEIDLRVVKAAEFDLFDPAAREAFFDSPWRVSKDANRIGYRLEGPGLRLRHPVELFSHGILPGTVQVPPAGQPIIQLADANTCGGYPKIACVIGADLWKLAQLPVGSSIRFSPIEADDAKRDSRAEAHRLAELASLAARLSRLSRPSVVK